MNVKEAVAVARSYVSDVFSEESLAAPTLEEVWFDDSDHSWCITLGVRRKNLAEAPWADPLGLKASRFPDYKVVRISDKDGTVQSIKNRDVAIHEG